MASPDFREYIDLTINDLQPSEIYSLARDYALVSLPEFNPRVGSVEDALLEAISYISGLVTGAVNRLPDGLMEGILRLMGFFREEATFSSGNVVFSAIDATGLTIPAGTQVAFTETTAEGVIVHIYETTASVVIAEGDTESAPSQIVCIEAGQKPIITDGAALTILTPVSRLFEATFDGTFTQGEDTETDAEFFNRGATYLASLSRSLATADQVTNYLLSAYPEAFRVSTYDLTRLQKFVVDKVDYFIGNGMAGASVVHETASPYDLTNTLVYTNGQAEETNVKLTSTPFDEDPANFDYIRVGDTSISDYDGVWEIDSISAGIGNSTVVYYDYSPGTSTTDILYPTRIPTLEFLDQISFSADDSPGSITVFMSDISGASLSAEDKAIIGDDIRARAIAGLQVYVADVLVAPISLSVDIAVLDGFSALDVRNQVDDALTSYLSPAEYPFTSLVKKNALISLISQISGVSYVDTITLTSDNTAISYIDGSGDAIFRFKGTLPSATVTVSSI